MSHAIRMPAATPKDVGHAVEGEIRTEEAELPHQGIHNDPVSWQLGPAVIELPDGARLRGRGLRNGAPPEPRPEWGLYLLGKPPAATSWPGRYLRWPDFWLPLSAEDARSAFEEAHRLAAEGIRVEVACAGGRGRTGTALACIAQLGGVAPECATDWVREHYDARGVETPWQQRYVRRFTRSSAGHP